MRHREAPSATLTLTAAQNLRIPASVGGPSFFGATEFVNSWPLTPCVRSSTCDESNRRSRA
jgi:hypothetical protein